MKTSAEKYSKEMDKLIKSKKFKKLDIDEQLMSMLALSSKYKLFNKK